MSRHRVVIRREARRDMVRYYGWLAETAGIDTAERFLSAADRAFDQLAHEPKLGAPAGSRNARLALLRKWRIEGFRRTIVFYIPADGVIRIVRVLDASSDWWALLDIS